MNLRTLTALALSLTLVAFSCKQTGMDSNTNSEMGSNTENPIGPVEQSPAAIPPVESTPYQSLLEEMKTKGDRLETHEWTKELFARSFNPMDHLEIIAGEQDAEATGVATMALADPLWGVLYQGRIVTAFAGCCESVVATSKVGREFLNYVRIVQVSPKVYALYPPSSAAAGTSSVVTGAQIAAAAHAAATVTAAAGVVVVGYLVVDYVMSAYQAEALGKDLSTAEKQASWSGSNSYWSNFCRLYGFGC